eukprot:450644_1
MTGVHVATLLYALCSKEANSRASNSDSYSVYLDEGESFAVSDEEWFDDSLWSTIDVLETVDFLQREFIKKCIGDACLCQYLYDYRKYPCYSDDDYSFNSILSESNGYNYDYYYDEMDVTAQDIVRKSRFSIERTTGNLFHIVTNDSPPKFKGQLWFRFPNFEEDEGHRSFYIPPKRMVWTEYTRKFNAHELTHSEKFAKALGVSATIVPDAIKDLRSVTKDLLLGEAVSDYDPTHTGDCYENMGSVTYTSDFDFSYVRWDKPQNMIDYFLKFTHAFKTIFGADSPEVFDMNFYISTAFIQGSACWATLDVSIKSLFKHRTDSIYEFIPVDLYTKRPRFKSYDHYITYVLIKRRLDYLGDTQSHPEVNVVKRLQYGAMFYDILDRIKTGKLPITDEIKLSLKILKNEISFYSDESYISNQALMLIVFIKKRDEMKTLIRMSPTGIYTACLDNMVFIKGYYNEYRDRADSYLKFWNKASKYIMRIGYLFEMFDDFRREPVGKIYAGYQLYPKKHSKRPLPRMKGHELLMKNIFYFAVKWNEVQPIPFINPFRKIRGDIALGDIAGATLTPTTDYLLANAREYWGLVKQSFPTLDDMWKEVFDPLLKVIYNKVEFPKPDEALDVMKRLEEMEAWVEGVVGVQSDPLHPLSLTTRGPYAIRPIWKEDITKGLTPGHRPDTELRPLTGTTWGSAKREFTPHTGMRGSKLGPLKGIKSQGH